MRIATSQTFKNGISSLQDRQSELLRVQQQMTSGKRVEKASDDPTAAARAERALASIGRSEASQRALEASQASMTMAESALGEAGDLMQEAREALVEAGDGTYGDEERKVLSQKLQGIRNQLLGLANQKDSAGNFLFAGQGAASAPFVDSIGGVTYNGVSGQTQVASGEPLPMTVDGEQAWMTAPTGNGVFETRATPGSSGAWIDAGRVTDPSAITNSTYTLQFSVSGGSTTYSVLQDGNPTALTNVAYKSGQAIEIDGMSFTVTGAPANGDGFEIAPSSTGLSVFDALDSAIAELSSDGRTPMQHSQTYQRALRDIDSSMTRLQSVRSAVGETLNRADSISGRLADSKLQAQTERSTAEDLDLVAAVSDFQAKKTGYDAALQAYSMVQKLSLFDYLR